MLLSIKVDTTSGFGTVATPEGRITFEMVTRTLVRNEKEREEKRVSKCGFRVTPFGKFPGIWDISLCVCVCVLIGPLSPPPHPVCIRANTGVNSQPTNWNRTCCIKYMASSSPGSHCRLLSYSFILSRLVCLAYHHIKMIFAKYAWEEMEGTTTALWIC